MRRVVLVVLLSSVLAGHAAVCYGQGYADAVGNVPQRLKPLRLGMSVTDVQNLVPDAKPMIATTEPRSALLVSLRAPDVWDAAMLELVNGKLEAISLLLGVNKTSDLAERSEKLLDDLIARNGATYLRMITLNSSRQPVPTRVWMKEDFQMFAIGPSAGISTSGKEIFRADPALRVGVARKTRPIGEMAEIPSAEEMRDLLFRAVSPADKN